MPHPNFNSINYNISQPNTVFYQEIIYNKNMYFTNNYNSPIGEMLLVSKNDKLCGLWLQKQKYYARTLKTETAEKDSALFDNVKSWLDIYFSGINPSFNIPLLFEGTPFQKEVWDILCDIPYGNTMTYKEIANTIARRRGINKMSAQAVGGAVGRNNIAILVPCHRVVGSNGSLTGFASGLDNKIALLKCEHIDMNAFFIPSN